jgi:hypothetical protein
MIPLDDPFPCVELDCGYLSVRTLAECEKARCPWTYTRRREEDMIERAEKDARAREGNTPRLTTGQNAGGSGLNPPEMHVSRRIGRENA